jgi:hypothetical protein
MEIEDTISHLSVVGNDRVPTQIDEVQLDKTTYGLHAYGTDNGFVLLTSSARKIPGRKASTKECSG